MYMYYHMYHKGGEARTNGKEDIFKQTQGWGIIDRNFGVQNSKNANGEHWAVEILCSGTDWLWILTIFDIQLIRHVSILSFTTNNKYYLSEGSIFFGFCLPCLSGIIFIVDPSSMRLENVWLCNVVLFNNLPFSFYFSHR